MGEKLGKSAVSAFAQLPINTVMALVSRDAGQPHSMRPVDEFSRLIAEAASGKIPADPVTAQRQRQLLNAAAVAVTNGQAKTLAEKQKAALAISLDLDAAAKGELAEPAYKELRARCCRISSALAKN